MGEKKTPTEIKGFIVYNLLRLHELNIQVMISLHTLCPARYHC